MSYCIYLRKSRKDEELGELETLAKHEKALLSLAEKQRLNVTKIYREVVSGDTISSRPEMQNLLRDISNNLYTGVLVMEVERLARGNTIDQGTVAETFKISNTKIITPVKTYNPSDEHDEEYFEFGLFMSRREYKTINRRLQRGRLASVNEGCYLGSVPPYGYDRYRIDKKYTVKENKEQSQIVKLIFDLYTEKNLGISKISNELNNSKVKPLKSEYWSNSTIQGILKNPIYIGMIKWNSRKTISVFKDGNIKKTRPRAKEYILVNGLHEPIISEEQFEKAKNIMESSSISPIRSDPRSKLQNPLAGITKCGYCGHNMVRRPYAKSEQKETLICPGKMCKNISSPLYVVENKLFSMIDIYVSEYRLHLGNSKPNAKNKIKKIELKNIENEILKTKTQLSSLHNLLEQGVYDAETFINRSTVLNKQLKELEALKINLKETEVDSTVIVKFLEDLANLKEKYMTEQDIASKNKILKQYISHTIYKKDKNCRWHNKLDDFELLIFPKVPK